MKIDLYKNFTTPLGMRINLNPVSYIRILSIENSTYSDEQLSNLFQEVCLRIDSLYVIPIMLINVLAMATIIVGVSILTFSIATLVLFFGGVKLSRNCRLANAFALDAFGQFFIILSPYFYIALAIVFFICGSTHLILPFIVSKFFVLENYLCISDSTPKRIEKKYTNFHEKELCAFSVLQFYCPNKFHSLDDCINTYLEYVPTDEFYDEVI